MSENDSTGNAVDRLTYLLIGAGIGAAVALLFAPKAGRELRGDIKDASRKGLDYTTERARQLGDKATEVYGTTTAKAQELYSQTASKAQDLVEAGKGSLHAKKEQLQAAIDAGKEAYAEEKDRLKASGSAGSTGNA